MAKKLVKFLRPNRPDYLYLKQVFKHTRQMLEVNFEKSRKRLPELLTDSELVAFYEAVWNARNPSHLVMIKQCGSKIVCCYFLTSPRLYAQ